MATYTKVFTGNLSFKTKEDQLAEQFAAAGKVITANIITRGPRSLGYGFVEFETEQEAQSAVSLLNKKNIDGREINVELAKPREDKPPQQQQNNDQPPRRRGGFRGGRRGGRAGNNNNGNNNNNNNNNENNNNEGGSSNQGQERSGDPAPRPPRQRRPRNTNREAQQASPAQGQQQEQQEGDSAQPQTGEQNNTRGRGRGGRGRSGRGRGGRGRGGRRTYNRAPRPQTVESTTSLFVANLPFELDDAKLLELFKDHKAVKAHVVTNFQGRSRGFGFVDFEENDQKPAFDATNQNQIVVNNRPLTVKIALVEDKTAAPQPVEATTETPAQN